MLNTKAPADKLTLNNGYAIPCVGFGTYKTPPEETCEIVKKAIDTGYRHIDTAAYYFNEEGVGRAVKECGLPREELFITTKVWNTERGYDKTMASFESSMKALGLEYLDLFLIHWPANYLQFGAEAKKINADTWRALETLYGEGRIKSIGLSNFMSHHIEALLETAKVKPQVNQIELHPGWLQAGVLRFCKDNDITNCGTSEYTPSFIKEDFIGKTYKEGVRKFIGLIKADPGITVTGGRLNFTINGSDCLDIRNLKLTKKHPSPDMVKIRFAKGVKVNMKFLKAKATSGKIKIIKGTDSVDISIW